MATTAEKMETSEEGRTESYEATKGNENVPQAENASLYVTSSAPTLHLRNATNSQTVGSAI